MKKIALVILLLSFMGGVSYSAETLPYNVVVPSSLSITQNGWKEQPDGIFASSDKSIKVTVTENGRMPKVHRRGDIRPSLISLCYNFFA